MTEQNTEHNMGKYHKGGSRASVGSWLASYYDMQRGRHMTELIPVGYKYGIAVKGGEGETIIHIYHKGGGPRFRRK